MNEHIVTAFEEELNHLTADVARLGGLAEALVGDSVTCVVRRDVPLAQALIVRDKQLDDLEIAIERAAVALIARRQPIANDLRRVVSAMKIAANLERCGDLAKNIAKRSLVLAESDPVTPFARSIERMGRLVASRLKEVLDAYASGEVAGAVAVWSRDDEIDGHYESLFRELLTYMMGDPRTITGGAHLLFVAKNLERIGDHATNIAEIVHYECTGRQLSDQRPKLDAVP